MVDSPTSLKPSKLENMLVDEWVVNEWVANEHVHLNDSYLNAAKTCSIKVRPTGSNPQVGLISTNPTMSGTIQSHWLNSDWLK